MRLATLSFLLVTAAACGGKSKTPATTGNTGGGTPAAGAVPAPWTEVFVEGATFTLDNSSDGVPSEEPTTVVATVGKITHDAHGATAELTWKDPDGTEAGNGLPSLVRVDGDLVTFGEGEYAEHFPKPSAGEATGLYANINGDTICYGDGPGPDAGPCEDVCYAELCVEPGKGIVSGSGTWWPNYEMFEQVAPK